MKTTRIVVLFIVAALLNSCYDPRSARSIYDISLTNSTNDTIEVETNISDKPYYDGISTILSGRYLPGETKAIVFIKGQDEYPVGANYFKIMVNNKMKTDSFLLGSQTYKDTINIFNRGESSVKHTGKRNQNKYPDTYIYKYTIIQEDINEAQ